MRTLFAAAILFLSFLPARSAVDCVACHAKHTPGLVADWRQSKHATAEVDCATCHGDSHSSAADAVKAKIPTLDTCRPCHEKQVMQFESGKHGAAWTAMKAMPTIHWQPMAMIDGMKGCGGW